MNLKIVVEGQTQHIKIPNELIIEAADFFLMMDNEMDRGYQMSQFWVEKPDVFQRCQIAADKILTALQTDNEKTATLMAAYILFRMPDTKIVTLSQNGDMSEHDIENMDLGLY